MTQHNPPERDINAATKDELMQIPEFGSQLADRILENRPFHNPHDIECLFADNDDPRLQEIRRRYRFPHEPDESLDEPQGEARYE